MTNKEQLQTVQVPLDEFILEIAREAAREVIEKHMETCKVHCLEADVHAVDGRVRLLELRWARLVGVAAGAGAAGGLIGSLIPVIIKLIPKVL